MEIERTRKNKLESKELRNQIQNKGLKEFKGIIKSGETYLEESTYRVIRKFSNGNITLYDTNNNKNIGTQISNIYDTVEGNNKGPDKGDDDDTTEEKKEDGVTTKKLPSPNQSLLTQNKYDISDTAAHIFDLISVDIKNIWMVGPAGCGKTTISQIVADLLDRECFILSCGIGTGATEFVGYKYPERSTTRFATFYTKPSIIVLDEFTALDPAVAQIANAALANNELETTTGVIKRHPDCIIVATSNTFGNGADRQYVANNQLDASTIDRFVGGIVHVEYSKKYEMQFDPEVVNFVWSLRNVIKDNELRRIASTRMIIEGEKLKRTKKSFWKDLLISNWTNDEKQLLYGT